MLYFRSDTRHPSEVFVHGFIPRFFQEEWSIMMSFSLRGPIKLGKVGDASSATSVNFSSNFYATPMFPVGSDTSTFIYFMCLPDPIPVNLNLQDPELDRLGGHTIPDLRKKVPEFIKYSIMGDEKKVLDISRLQFLQASILLEQQKPQLPRHEWLSAARKIGWPLCAAEMLTNKVNPEDIYGAIPCIRRTNIAPSGAINDFQTRFRIQKPFYINPGFKIIPEEGYKYLDVESSNILLSNLGEDRDYVTTPTDWGHVWAL